jgi:CubicO group peptidase (beta-lactamase class C family)
MWLLEHYWNKDRPPYNDDVMDLLARHRLHLYFRPGTRFAYSNTGYVVLASVIEKVTGMRYDEFMEENIFSPLNMEDTYVYSTAYGKNNNSHLNGYRQWGRYFRYVPHTVNDGTVGDKGIYSTVLDLYKWDKGLYENKLISEHTKKQAFQALELKNGNHYPYGFGFRLKDSDGRKMVYHYGKWNGFRTGIIRFIEDTSTIIMLNHTDRPYNSRITKNINKILHETT